MVKQLWIDFKTYNKFRWTWFPRYLRSQIIFSRGGKMWLAPHSELSWGMLVLHWTGYSHEKEYKGTYNEDHECPAHLMQHRINELEHAIREHRNRPLEQGRHANRDLWKVLQDDDTKLD